jgi:thiosulfate reductase cytochrome b subunit
MASTTIDNPAVAATKRVVSKHHALVRITHWLNIPLLLGLGLSGLSIYWAAPVYKHTSSLTDQSDYLADIGVWVVRHVPGQHGYSPAADWFYNHASLGTGLLAPALRLHWLFAYLFMANGLLYLIGLGVGGGYKALLPRRSDLADAFRMIRYYIGILPARLLRRAWKHPLVTSKYNALQRAAYFSMPVFGILSVLTGWAIHKPAQLGWLQALFGGYNWARVWHFWLLWIFAAFVIPHVILVLADGWDTLRSMVVGWSERIGASHDA